MNINLSREEIKMRRELQNLVSANIVKIIAFQRESQENGDYDTLNLLENGMAGTQKDVHSLNIYDIEAMEQTIKIMNLE